LEQRESPVETGTERTGHGGARGRISLVARVVAWLTVILYAAGLGTTYLLERGTALREENSMEDAVILTGFGPVAAVGALLVAKRPANLVGWILAAVAIMVALFPSGDAYAAYVMTTRGQPDALAVLGAWVQGWYWFLILGLLFIYLPLLFPDGRLPTRRWLPVAAGPGIGLLGLVVLGMLTDTLSGQDVEYRIDNPIGIEGLAPVEDLPIFAVLGGIVYFFGVLGAFAAVVTRFRRSRGVERQQMKWFLFAAAPLLAIPLEGYVPEFVDEIAFGWVLIGLPAAIGIAVLKYRLYDIDVVINRTLVYGTLTVSLALVYLGSVALLRGLIFGFTGQSSQLAVVASTLTIAALFGPLRRRIQNFVDRRFYRSKYDAARVLAEFSLGLRDATDLERLNEDLVAVVRETVQPEHASLWLRDPAAAREPRTGS
jgi:hypothetical protein